MAPDLNKFHCFFFIFATHTFLFSRGEKRAKAHDRRVEGCLAKEWDLLYHIWPKIQNKSVLHEGFR